MRVEQLVRPAIVAEFKYADVAVGGGTGEQAATLVRSPGDAVDGGSVQGEIKNFCPGASGGGGGGARSLLAPYEDFAVVGGGG